MANEFPCTTCANQHTVVCKDCTFIRSPSGRERRPKQYIKLDEPLTLGSFISENEKVTLDALRHREKLGDEDLMSVIEHCLMDGHTIPLAVVMEYNRQIEAKRITEQEG